MLEFCLITLTWSLDPAAWTPTTPRSINAVASCVRPSVHVALQKTDDTMKRPELLPALQAEDWLDRWEESSRELSWSRSRREEFRRTIQDQFNQHTAVAAEALIGKIDARRLKESYDWTVTEHPQDEILLEAIPRDEMDRLFLRSFHIWLQTETGALRQIEVIGRNQQPLTVWTSDEPADRNTIQLIEFKEEVPPLPVPRFANTNVR